MEHITFSMVNEMTYHSTLIHFWLRLEKDGLIKKNDEFMFSVLGRFFVQYTNRYGKLPEYNNVMDFMTAQLKEEE